MNPKDLQKAMKRLGIKMEEISALKVQIDLEDGSRIVIDDPQVLVMRAKGQPPMLYIVGEMKKEEKKEEKEEKAHSFTEEDVALVAEQAGVSVEEARKALEETGGDIAEAILKLQQGE